MTKITSKVWALIGSSIILIACEVRPNVSVEDLLQSDDIEEFNRYATAARALGAAGIPLFLEVIDDSLDSKYSVLSYGKLNSSLFQIHSMASQGIIDFHSVPVLIRAIEEQIAIDDTLMTADALRIITGVDPGYSADFVASYTPEEEETRHQMIEQWREWYSEYSE